jgi:cell division septum initiation protein DivIVA
VLGRSFDDSEEKVTPLSQQPTQAKGYTDVGEAVAGVLRAAEEAAEKIRKEARAQAIEIVEAARGDATARIVELTREAERTRHDADDYANDIRQAVESYGSRQRREADEEARKILAKAEGQARATREVAQEMAGRIEDEARLRGDRLRDEIRSLEERRERVLVGLRELAAELNELFPELAAGPQDGPDLLDAIHVERPS